MRLVQKHRANEYAKRLHRHDKPKNPRHKPARQTLWLVDCMGILAKICLAIWAMFGLLIALWRGVDFGVIVGALGGYEILGVVAMSAWATLFHRAFIKPHQIDTPQSEYL